MRRLVLLALPVLVGLTVGLAGCGKDGKDRQLPAGSYTTTINGTTTVVAGSPTSSLPSRRTPGASSVVPPRTPQERAIGQVFDSPLGTAFQSLFPRTPRAARCLIRLGGPFNGRRIPATCKSEVVYNWGGKGPLVRFTESWPYRLFHGPGAKTQRRQGELEHRWSFQVDGRRVRLVKQAGAFPPQAVR